MSIFRSSSTLRVRVLVSTPEVFGLWLRLEGRRRLWGGLPGRLLTPKASRLLVCSEFLAQIDLDMLGPADQVVPCASWAEVLIHLQAAYPQTAKVAVYP